MSTSSLVLMAAGLGSRFGGVKQLAEIGPNGESLMDYTIKDALLAGIEDVIITAKQDQCFVPWPEGASYPGFIFARGDEPSKVVDAVHAAHRALEFEMDTIIPIGRSNPLSV